MSKSDARQFQSRIFIDLEQRLRSSGWASGACEAHGLLTALACRGVNPQQLAQYSYLFNISGKEELLILQGLFELVVRDLESATPVFDLLLPGDERSPVERTDEMANWCGGFVQGYCHDGESILQQSSAESLELFRDIMDISGMQLDEAQTGEEIEKSLTEIEEFLRAGIQLMYDESNAGPPPANREVH